MFQCSFCGQYLYGGRVHSCPASAFAASDASRPYAPSSEERNVCPRGDESYGENESHYCPTDARIADSLERIADALERMNKREDALRRVRKAPSGGWDNAMLDAALSALKSRT